MLGINKSLVSPSQVKAFSLLDIDGLTAWYKFNTGISTESAGGEVRVTLWQDSSGNTRHMGNTTATNKRPLFDSSDQTVDFVSTRYLELNSGYGTDTHFPNSNALTVICALRTPYDASTTGIFNILYGTDTNDNMSVGNLKFVTGSYYAFSGAGSDQNYAHTDSGQTTYPHVNNELFIYAVRRTGTTLELFRNNRANVVSSTTESNTSSTFDINSLGMKVGGNSEVSIAEVAVYNSGLSDKDLDAAINNIKVRVQI